MKQYSIQEIADNSKRFPVVDGPFGTQLHADEYTTEGVPVIRITNLSYQGKFNEKDLVFITKEKAEILKRSEVVRDDIIIAKTGATIGKSAKFPLEYGIIASSCLKVSLNKKMVNPDYFLYQITSFQGQKRIIDGSSGSTRTTINNEPFKKIEFDFPEKPVQDYVVQILSKADAAIAQTEALIAKYQRIKTGLMQDLLTKGIDEHGNIRNEKTHRFKTEKGLRVPEEWEVKELKEIGNIVTGSTPPVKDENNYGEEYLFVTPADVTPNQFIVSTDRKLSKQGFSFCREILQNSICVVCIGSTIGKISMTNQVCTSNQQINSIVPFKSEFAQFYFYSLQIFLDEQLRREAGLQAVPIVNKSSFSKMIIPVPMEKNETLKILEHLNKIQNIFEKYQNNLSKLKSLKTGLMQDLLSGKVRVKIKEETLVNP